MLEVKDLVCARGDRVLFQGLSLSLAAGGLLLVAGTNGSGKTSLLRLLCGLGRPEAGEVRWRGESIATLREAYGREVVYMGHAHALKDDLSAIENLQMACTLAGQTATRDAVARALMMFGLKNSAHLPVRALSQGQKRRAALSRLALSSQTPLWILDEPFAALDVAAAQHLEQMVGVYLDCGGSIIFTTHQDTTITSRVTQRIDLNSVANARMDTPCGA